MATFDKVTKARTRLIMGRPFYGTLALRMKVKEDPTCDTAWTDGYTFGYNPKFINKLPLEQVIFIWAHECLHPAMMHHVRQGARNHFKWNVACDYAINPILKADDLIAPPDALIDPKYDGMSAENIYNLLPPDLDGPGNVYKLDPSACGEIRQANNPGPTEQEWRQWVAAAAHAARMAGQLHGGLERFVNDILYTATPWRDLLRQFIVERANDDYTWLKANRRFVHQRMWLPSAYSESMGEVVIAVDTSGSIGDKELALFGSEFNSVIEDCRPKKTHRVFCDAKVHRTDEYAPDDDIPWSNLGNIGGGGTDFKPVFKWIEKHGIEPKCLIYLTDMYGDFPKDPPPYPVLWASITDNYEAPFGSIVHIDMKGEQA